MLRLKMSENKKEKWVKKALFIIVKAEGKRKINNIRKMH